MPYTLDQDLEAAAKAGFDAVEIWSGKLDTYLENHDITELKFILQAYGLRVASICPYSLIGFSDNQEHLRIIERAAEIAAEISCPLLIVCADTPPQFMDLDDAYDTIAAAARSYAERAFDHGVKIAIEPLGRHPLIPGPNEAIEIIKRARHAGLGLILDTFHYYKSDIKFDAISAIPTELLQIVHVNDCENRPLEDLNDQHRVYMGAGVIPLKEMLDLLRKKGYKKALSVEIFRASYWEKDPLEISITAKAAYDGMIQV